jgi:hypothetical protein
MDEAMAIAKPALITTQSACVVLASATGACANTGVVNMKTTNVSIKAA